MAGISRFTTSLKSIVKQFTDSNKNLFTYSEIEGIFEDGRQSWRLPQSMTTDKFLMQLIEKTDFREIELNFSSVESRRLFMYGNATPEEIASASFNKAYLSHFTASSMNGLTEQIPKTIYVTVEQSAKHEIVPEIARRGLIQENIDKAFKKPQRTSEAIADWEGVKIVLLRGKSTGNLGVKSIGSARNLRVTDIERTLIDMTVRPSYSGGIFEVLKAYQNAGENSKVSVNKLLSYLKRMDFIYPYHQAIGFYMEKSGAFKEQQLEKFRELTGEYKFYLAYDMQEMEFSEDWNIYYPKGLR
ncbi:hypothetical protein EZ428_11630 [Pedobacter frigiditerrae]|uniref:AbiEi antitoxin C-terminal domain-containing protein n=1 Tax=Pedobacter frigiditerrae TaxID=2530452 RepID=A0A4R0MYF7_9SPHI|nr:hypothetical protein [Pedobacter frigiditerrae]TCC92368.1 hypothetical protein EZ428_11630 [Pedobacter frigiditerrae]